MNVGISGKGVILFVSKANHTTIGSGQTFYCLVRVDSHIYALPSSWADTVHFCTGHMGRIQNQLQAVLFHRVMISSNRPIRPP